jgi:hypothetical protein
MFIKKLSTGLFILITLNGCVQSTAFLGPAVTGASTGNIYQAGLSYSTNLIVEEFTGKTSIENFQELLVPKKNDNKISKSVKKSLRKNTDEFLVLKKNNNNSKKLIKKTIEKNSLEFYTMVKNLYLHDKSN